MSIRHVEVARASSGDRVATAGRALVISQHDVVRRQLVAYLGRTPGLVVSGAAFSWEAIVHAGPGVVVLDLSRLSEHDLARGLDAAQRAGAQVIALASIHDAAAEQMVTRSGGRYRLKSAGADDLASLVKALAATTTG
jgi:DNA-binding NarL/FixJ family response regulator